MNDAKPYQIRGTLQTLLALRVDEPDAPAFFDQLRNDVLRSPGFFKHAPVVIDVQPLQGTAPFDLRRFVARVRACDLQPIGVANGDAAWNDAASAVGLSVMTGGKPMPTDAPIETQPSGTQPSSPPEPAERAEPPAVASGNAPTVLSDSVVRSGQQVVANDGDAICLAAVANGADVIARGNIHVYAPLRGRAFAGFEGDRAAMIFCDRLEAELVSIAGYHLVSDELPSAAQGRRVRIRLAADTLVVDVIT